MAARAPVYTTKIIKAGALLTEARLLLAHWDLERDVDANLRCLRRDNLLGLPSGKRVDDVLTALRQRYLGDPLVWRGFVALTNAPGLRLILDRLLYFHAAQADPLLADVVRLVVEPLRDSARQTLTVADLDPALRRMGPTWSAPTRTRVSQGLLSTLRDFGVLQGTVRKRHAPFHLPVEAFAAVALDLRRGEPSGERLVAHPAWRLFFLDRARVERLFAEAHQQGLLEYHALGAVVRIEFPTDSLEEFAHVIARRAA